MDSPGNEKSSTDTLIRRGLHSIVSSPRPGYPFSRPKLTLVPLDSGTAHSDKTQLGRQKFLAWTQSPSHQRQSQEQRQRGHDQVTLGVVETVRLRE